MPDDLEKEFSVDPKGRYPRVVYSNLRRVHRDKKDGNSFTLMYSYIDPQAAEDPDGGRRLFRPTESVDQEQLQNVNIHIKPQTDGCGGVDMINLGQVDELYNGFAQ
jgi:hypothetical protein